MTGNEYQQLAMRTNDGKSSHRLYVQIVASQKLISPDCKDFGGLIMGCLGLSGEAGEFTDMIKKWIFHEKPLDLMHAEKELGDIMWYVAIICESFGWKLEDIMQLNIDKLKARYPEGFNIKQANNREAGDI